MKQRNKHLYNTEYAAMNCVNWMLYCVLFSFASVFLLDRGYSNTRIGIILAMGNVLAMPLQPALAQVADRSRKIGLQGLLTGMVVFMAVMVLLILLISGQSPALAVVYVLALMAMQGIQPLVNSFSFYLESWGVPMNFGICRAVGSLGFSMISVILGNLVKAMGTIAVPVTGMVLLALFLLILLVFYLQRGDSGKKEAVAAEEETQTAGTTSLAGFFRAYPKYTRFLVGVALIFAGHTFIQNFVMQLVQHVGGDSADMGTLCSVNALLEMPAMLAFSLLTRRFKCTTLLRTSLVVFTVKIALALVAKDLAGLYLSTALQLVGYALFIPASVRYANDVMAPEDAVKGQAFITTMITLGAIFSSLAGGRIIDVTGMTAALGLFLVLSVIGTAVALTGVEKTEA